MELSLPSNLPEVWQTCLFNFFIHAFSLLGPEALMSGLKMIVVKLTITSNYENILTGQMGSWRTGIYNPKWPSELGLESDGCRGGKRWMHLANTRVVTATSRIATVCAINRFCQLSKYNFPVMQHAHATWRVDWSDKEMIVNHLITQHIRIKFERYSQKVYHISSYRIDSANYPQFEEWPI